MAVAVATGVPPDCWLADTRAMATAADILEKQAEEVKRRRRG